MNYTQSKNPHEESWREATNEEMRLRGRMVKNQQ